MLNIFKARVHQGKRTMPFPAKKPVLPKRFRGLPEITATSCTEGCTECVTACPTESIIQKERNINIDLGKCLFCGTCQDICQPKKISFTKDYRLSTDKRESLIVKPGQAYKLAEKMQKETKRVFGRSINLRQVSAAGCNACEADINVLATVGFDLSRFGIHIVASPRHADVVVITGPISKNMKLALDETYKAVPKPSFVMSVGACAVSGGLYNGSEEVAGVGNDMKVDLYIPGCPPHPITILDGLLRLLGRLPDVTV